MRNAIIPLFTLLFAGLMSVSAQQVPTTFTYKLGTYEIILLSEGQNIGNTGILVGATDEIVKETIPEGTFPMAMNAFLVKTPDKNILIDTGIGKMLLENLRTFGVTPDAIDVVAITHMHGDHIGGMLKDDEPVFPHSVLHVGEVEKDYWSSDAFMNAFPESRRGGFLQARRVIKAYEENLEVVNPSDPDEERGDGIYFIEAYGHTPGHLACLVKSGEEEMLIWADLAHAMAVQMAYPQVAVTYDVDPEMAVKARKRLLEYVAKRRIPVAGMHVPYPGIGRVESNGEGGYLFTPSL